MFGLLAVLSSLVCTTTLSCKNEDKCSCCMLYIVLLSILFAISIALYFVYYKCTSRNNENVSRYDYIYQTKNS